MGTIGRLDRKGIRWGCNKMIIVKLMGGMGNQMFQYALYRALLAQGKEVKLDRSKFAHFDEIRNCFLDNGCFDLPYELCTKKEARKYVLGTGMAARVLMKLFGDKDTHYYEKRDYEYDSCVMQLSEGYLDGFWQTWKYFKEIEADVRKAYRFINGLTGKDKMFEEQIRNTDSVAVHVRKGDYDKLQNLYGNICTKEYYQKAIKTISQIVETPVFYFFSNDMEWTRATFGEKGNYVYVEGNSEDKGYIDMQLMSECKHQIMANSSFSWWAAYLNNNPNKKVICPKRWINTKETPDVYYNGWIRVAGEAE